MHKGIYGAVTFHSFAPMDDNYRRVLQTMTEIADEMNHLGEMIEERVRELNLLVPDEPGAGDTPEEFRCNRINLKSLVDANMAFAVNEADDCARYFASASSSGEVKAKCWLIMSLVRRHAERSSNLSNAVKAMIPMIERS